MDKPTDHKDRHSSSPTPGDLGSEETLKAKYIQALPGDPKKSKKLPFGTSRASNRVPADPYDYEQRYPEDPYGEEMGPNARVWRMYLDEASKEDSEMVDGWKDTIDVLLVFAGLFSGVVTSFVLQTSQSLQPDQSEIAASLLTELVLLQRAVSNGTSADQVAQSPLDANSSFSPSTTDLWVNGLWFSSLAMSLSTSLFAVLIKQWIQHYTSALSGSPRDQVRLRQYRFLGVQKWRVRAIVGLLPVLLHFALFLFFAGLVTFLSKLNVPIAAAIGSIALLAYMLYFAANTIPVFIPQCPYRTPIYEPITELRRFYHLSSSYLFRSADNKDNTKPKISSEASDIEHRQDEVDGQAFVWLFGKSLNPSVSSITIQSMAGLPLGFQWPHSSLQEINFLDHFSPFLLKRFSLSIGKLERLCRANVQLLQSWDQGYPIIAPIQTKLKWSAKPLLTDLISSHCELGPLENQLIAVTNGLPSLPQSERGVLQERSEQMLSDGTSLSPYVWCNFFRDISPPENHSQLIVRLLESINKMFYNDIVWGRLRKVQCTFDDLPIDVMGPVLEHLHHAYCTCQQKFIRVISDARGADDLPSFYYHILTTIISHHTKSLAATGDTTILERCLDNLVKFSMEDTRQNVYGKMIQRQEETTKSLLENLMDLLGNKVTYDRFGEGADFAIQTVLCIISGEKNTNYCNLCGPTFTQCAVRHLLQCADRVDFQSQKWASLKPFDSLGRLLVCDFHTTGQAIAAEIPRTNFVKENRILGFHSGLFNMLNTFIEAANALPSHKETPMTDFLYETEILTWLCHNFFVQDKLECRSRLPNVLSVLARDRPDIAVWRPHLEWLVNTMRQSPEGHLLYDVYYSLTPQVVMDIQSATGIRDENLNLYRYVTGSDVVNVPTHWARIDGNLVYAPYTVPYLEKPDGKVNKKSYPVNKTSEILSTPEGQGRKPPWTYGRLLKKRIRLLHSPV